MATFQDLIELFRVQMSDEDPPYLWGDDEVLTYAMDAQDTLVRATGGIIDMQTAALCQLAVVANSPWSPINPYVLRLRSGRLLTTKQDIVFGSQGELKENYPYWDYGWSYPEASLMDDSFTGPTQFGILGMQENQVRWYPVPTVSETCQAVAYRLPYPRPSTQESAIEVGTEHHIHLVKWMKHMSFSKVDTETYNPKAAKENEEAFNAYCEKARREAERRRYKPRTVRSAWPQGARRTHF